MKDIIYKNNEAAYKALERKAFLDFCQIIRLLVKAFKRDCDMDINETFNYIRDHQLHVKHLNNVKNRYGLNQYI